MLKISPLFKKFTNLRANNSTIPRIKNAKFSGHCFYMNTNIQEDFQICISVPLKTKIIHYHNFTEFSFETDDPNEKYSALTNTFSLIVEKHALFKKKIARENHAPFRDHP